MMDSYCRLCGESIDRVSKEDLGLEFCFLCVKDVREALLKKYVRSMENNLIYRDSGFSIYRTYSRYGVYFTVFRGEKLGDFSSLGEAKAVCKKKNLVMEKAVFIATGGGLLLSGTLFGYLIRDLINKINP